MCLPRAVLLASMMAWSASGQTFTISTLAGSGPPKIPNNVPGTSASLNEPNSVAVDGKGNLFFTDQNTVFRLDAVTGVLTIAAGNGTVGSAGDTSPATSAQLSMPSGIAVDSAGNLYIADSGHYRIRKVSNGVITTVAGNGMTDGFSGDGGPATSAPLFDAFGVAVDSAGNLYIADSGHYRIRKVSNGVITTVAGNGTDGFSGDGGPATSAQLSHPGGVAVDSAGNLYIADTVNNRVRKVSNGVITTLAGGGTNPGDGPAASAFLANPGAVTVDSSGNLYIADGRSRIREVSNGMIITVAGNGRNGFSGDNGPATGAEFIPEGVAVDAAGNLYIADIYNSRIRKVSNGVITTVAGKGTDPAQLNGYNGPATSALLFDPEAVAVDATQFADIQLPGQQRGIVQRQVVFHLFPGPYPRWSSLQ